MAFNYSQNGGAGDWTSALSWTSGAAPIAGADVGILEGTVDFITNLPTVGIDYNSLKVGREFAGSLGAPSNTISIGSVPSVLFEGPRCKRCYLEVDTTETVTDLIVEDTHPTNPDGLVISANGTGVITRMRVRGGQNCVLAATASVTRFIMESIARAMKVRIESGAAIPTAMIGAGIVDCYAAISSELHVAGGVWNHLGATLFNVPTIIVARGATLNLWSGGGTFTNVYNFGMINCDGGLGKPKTITNYFDCGGILDKRGLGSNVTITNKFMSSGQLLGA